MDLAIAIITGTLVGATPLIFAALGELVVERSGVLNLGIEGMMLIGAVTAFGVAFAGYPPIAAALAAMLTGAAAALLFGVLALTLMANQYAAGLALTLFGAGLSTFLGHGFGAAPLTAITKISIPFLSSIPVIGPLLFRYDPMVYIAFSLIQIIWFALYRTKMGLVIRVIGESPQSAHAIGYNVILVRYLSTLFGGAMAGLGGAYLALAYTPLWVPNMTAGKGWIALALVVFSGWRPFRVMLGAWLFGGVTILQLHAQGFGIDVPSQLLSALPYVATIFVLVVISRNKIFLLKNFPMSLGKPFHPGN